MQTTKFCSDFLRLSIVTDVSKKGREREQEPKERLSNSEKTIKSLERAVAIFFLDFRSRGQGTTLRASHRNTTLWGRCEQWKAKNKESDEVKQDNHVAAFLTLGKIEMQSGIVGIRSS